MFVDAIEKAQQFTRPVVISSRRNNGKCESAIGTFVVINEEGWAVTAHHIVEHALRLSLEAAKTQGTLSKRKEVENDQALTRRERQKQLRNLKVAPRATTNTSGWWSWDGAASAQIQSYPMIDLAFVKLKGIPSGQVSLYPSFKDPSKPMRTGRSLCRIGFPFHSIEPIFHANRNQFELPPPSLPLPFFPNDGIFTRTVEVNLPSGAPTPPFPFRFLETSSPGLKGQSGGPIFDSDGNVWAIQSRTSHFPLGFNPPVPGGKSGAREYQFLNVGWGVHAESIVCAMRQLGIAFNLSPQ